MHITFPPGHVVPNNIREVHIPQPLSLAYSIRLLLLFKISLYSFGYRRTMWSLNQVHTCSRLSVLLFLRARFFPSTTLLAESQPLLWQCRLGPDPPPPNPDVSLQTTKSGPVPRNQSNKTSRRASCYVMLWQNTLVTPPAPILLTRWIRSNIEFNKRRTLDQCCCFDRPTVQISRRSVSFVKKSSPFDDANLLVLFLENSPWSSKLRI